MADPTFETRLAARLHDVFDSQMGPHPIWADAPAALQAPDRRRRRWQIRVLAVAALLAIGGGALSLVGSWQPRPDDRRPSPEPTAPAFVETPVIPEIVRGQFVAQLGSAPGAAIMYPNYFIDLEDPVLVHGPSTWNNPIEIRAEARTEADWADRIVRFTPANAGSATVVIQAPLPCGEGRYLVRYHEAELTFTQPQDSCVDRLAILTARAWTHEATRLVPGERYSSWSFTEPFHFVMPPADPPLMPPGDPPVSAVTWLAPGKLSVGNVWWRGKFLDDWTLPIDRCDPGAGSLPDIPPSVRAFESWLRSNGRSVAIEERRELEVDGRTVVRYATIESSCPGQKPNTFARSWYLIPTGDDMILFNVYGDTETEYQVADEIVRSMAFD